MSTPLPSSCPHCHAASDFSVHHGLHFCNQCGKKVTQTNRTQPSTPSVTAASSAASASANAASSSNPAPSTPAASSSASNDNYSTPTRDEDDDVVTFKHAMQSPVPQRFPPQYDPTAPTPLPQSRTMPSVFQNANSTTQSSVSNKPNASPNPTTVTDASKPSSSPAPAGGSNVITLTEEEFTAMEETIRKEVLASAAAENEILTMEFDTLSKEHLKLQSEKIELQKTMDEMMESFAKVVEEANGRKNDYTAQMGILEAEMTSMRTQYQSQKAQLATMKDSYTKREAELEEKALLVTEQSNQLDSLRAEHETLRTQYDKLVRQAQDKLAASGNEYRILLQKNQTQDGVLQSNAMELTNLRRSKAELEQRNKEMETQVQTLQMQMERVESVATAKGHEASELRQTLAATTASLAETKSKYTDQMDIANRYKEQIVTQREQLRDMDEATRKANQFERESSRLTGENDALLKENQQLKSQLFDSFQVEKALKAQLENSGMSAMSVADTGKIARLESELAGVKNTLANKENEHKELMAICTDLISQVELLKAQQK